MKTVRAILKDKNGKLRTYKGGYGLLKKENCVAAWSISTGSKLK